MFLPFIKFSQQSGKERKFSSVLSKEAPSSYLLLFCFPSFSFLLFSFRLGRPRPPSVGTRTQRPTILCNGGRIAKKKRKMQQPPKFSLSRFFSKESRRAVRTQKQRTSPWGSEPLPTDPYHDTAFHLPILLLAQRWFGVQVHQSRENPKV